MQARTELIRPEHLRLGPQGPELFGEAAALVQAFALIEHVEHGRAKPRRDYQMDRLSLLLGHAQAHSPFWRARLPAQAASIADLPVLTRAELRAQVEAEGALPLPPDHGAPQKASTSGSTGATLTLSCSAFNAAYNESRYSFDDVVGGRRLDLPLTYVAAKVSDVEELDRWPSRTGSVWRTGPATLAPILGEHLEAALALLLAGPGGHVVTRPAVVEALLGRVRDSGRAPPPFADIITFSELVTAALREDVRTVLKARIADRYSAEEVGPIAFECRRSVAHYHVASSNVLVEVVDERRRPVAEGKVGDLLLTGLASLASPIVRYDIGDRAAQIGRCPCGHDGPTLRGLLGRRRSLIRLPDGRLFFLRPTIGMMAPIAPVESWRVIQTGPVDLTFEVVAPRPLTDAEREGLAALIRRLSSPAFVVTVGQVAAIDPGPGEKRQLVVNLLDDPRG